MVVLARWPENLVVTLLSLHQPVRAAQLSGGPQVLSLLLRAWPLPRLFASALASLSTSRVPRSGPRFLPALWVCSGRAEAVERSSR